MDDIFDLVAGTLANDAKFNNIEKNDSPKLTFRRDEDGVLWSYNAATGEKVGRIFEHGDEGVSKADIDMIDEI